MATNKPAPSKPATGGVAKPADAAPKTDEVAVQLSPNKIFSIVEPRSSKPFAVNDEWHHPEEGLRVFDGKAWVKKAS